MTDPAPGSAACGLPTHIHGGASTSAGADPDCKPTSAAPPIEPDVEAALDEWENDHDDWPTEDDLGDGGDLDPCNHCPHDNTRHRGDGCLDCGCDVPQ